MSRTANSLSAIDHSRTIVVAGRTAVIVPAGTRLGSFSRPLGAVSDTPEAALAAQHRDHAGDMILTHVGQRWQLWGRTATARGEEHTRDYEPMPDFDRRAKRRKIGSGTLYISE